MSGLGRRGLTRVLAADGVRVGAAPAPGARPAAGSARRPAIAAAPAGAGAWSSASRRARPASGRAGDRRPGRRPRWPPPACPAPPPSAGRPSRSTTTAPRPSPSVRTSTRPVSASAAARWPWRMVSSCSAVAGRWALLDLQRQLAGRRIVDAAADHEQPATSGQRLRRGFRARRVDPRCRATRAATGSGTSPRSMPARTAKTSIGDR